MALLFFILLVKRFTDILDSATRNREGGEKVDKKVILVSHGKLSEGMAHSTQMICGENEDLSYYGMMPGEHYTAIVEAIKEKASANPDTQYIVIADLLGGSVCNGCTELIGMENVKLISGMNMGLVIDLLFAAAPVSDEDIEESLRACKETIANVTPKYIKSKEPDGDANDFF